MVVVLVPVDAQNAAAQMHIHRAIREPVAHAGNDRGAGAGAAGHGLAGAALPHAHGDGRHRIHAHKFRIDPFGEELGVFKDGSNLGQIEIVQGGILGAKEDHAVGIAHGHGRDEIGPAQNLQGLADIGGPGIHAGLHLQGNVAGFKHGLAHVDGGAAHPAFVGQQSGHLDAGAGLDADDALAHKAVLVDIARHAADGIAAILTGVVYVYVCLKAWTGAFGVGGITQYVGAVTTLFVGVSGLLEVVGNMRVNARYTALCFEFLDIPNQMKSLWYYLIFILQQLIHSLVIAYVNYNQLRRLWQHQSSITW